MSETLSRSEFAGLLGAAKSTITSLCAKGLPVRDGRIPRDEALRWILKCTSGFRGGWVGQRRGKEDLHTRAKRLLTGGTVQPKKRAPLAKKTADSLEQFLDYLRSNAAERLPELARLLGLPEYVARDAVNVFDALLAGCGADDLMPDYAWPEFDYGGEPLTPKLEKQADALWEQITAICNDLRAAEGDTDPNAAH